MKKKKGRPKGYQHDEATIQKISEANKGRKFSQEARKRMSESALKRKVQGGYARGYKLSEETKRKMSQSATGRKMSQETKAKLSRIAKQRFIDDPTIGKKIGRKKGQSIPQATREKIRATLKARYADQRERDRIGRLTKQAIARKRAEGVRMERPNKTIEK